MVDDNINLKLDVKTIKDQFITLLQKAYIDNNQHIVEKSIKDCTNKEIVLAQAQICALYNSKKMHAHGGLNDCHKSNNLPTCRKRNGIISKVNDKENIPAISYSVNKNMSNQNKTCRENCLNSQKIKDNLNRDTQRNIMRNSYGYYKNNGIFSDISLIENKSPSKLSPRYVPSASDLKSSDVFHSTFNYPLHSTINSSCCSLVLSSPISSPLNNSNHRQVNCDYVNRKFSDVPKFKSNVEEVRPIIEKELKKCLDDEGKSLSKQRKIMQMCEKIITPASLICEKQKKILKSLYKKHVTLSNQSLLNAIELDEDIDSVSESLNNDVILSPKKLLSHDYYFHVFPHLSHDNTDQKLNSSPYYAKSLNSEEVVHTNNKLCSIKPINSKSLNTNSSAVYDKTKISQINHNQMLPNNHTASTNSLNDPIEMSKINNNIQCRHYDNRLYTNKIQPPTKHVSFHEESLHCAKETSEDFQEGRFNWFISCISQNQRMIEPKYYQKMNDCGNLTNNGERNDHKLNKVCNDNLIQIYNRLDGFDTSNTDSMPAKKITSKRKRALMKKMKRFNESFKHLNRPPDSSISTLGFF